MELQQFVYPFFHSNYLQPHIYILLINISTNIILNSSHITTLPTKLSNCSSKLCVHLVHVIIVGMLESSPDMHPQDARSIHHLNPIDQGLVQQHSRIGTLTIKVVRRIDVDQDQLCKRDKSQVSFEIVGTFLTSLWFVQASHVLQVPWSGSHPPLCMIAEVSSQWFCQQDAKFEIYPGALHYLNFGVS